jgi:hypothetical protein
MDRHDLIALKAKQNSLIVILLGIIILVFILYLLISFGYFKLDEHSITILISLIIAAIIVGIPIAYLSTIIDEYKYLYSGSFSASPKLTNTVSNIKNNMVIMPYTFFTVNDNFRKVYFEAVYSYLYKLPNASLPTLVKCLEIGIKELYKQLKQQATLSTKEEQFINNIDNKLAQIKKHKNQAALDNVELVDLIEAAHDYYPDKKQVLQYLRLLRNLIHSTNIIQEEAAKYALITITEVLNALYEIPESIKIKVKCEICGDIHTYDLNKKEYYIGNVISLSCLNPKIEEERRNYTKTLLPSQTEIHY